MVKKGYKQTEIGIIPNDWELKNVKDCFEICNNLRLPISQDIRNTMQGIYPYYGATKIQDYINEYRIDGEYALIGEDGDHFFKWYTNSMTILANGKFNVNNHAHLVKGNKKDTTTIWFYYFFKNRDITQFLTRQGAGRYKLSKAGLINLPCAYPKIEEQKTIAIALTDIDNLIIELETLIAKKKSIKQGAIQQLLSGKKRLKGFTGEWDIKKLGEVANMSSGGTPLTSIRQHYNGSIPWMVIADITKAGKYINSTEKKITELGVENSNTVIYPVETLYFAMYASIGKCTISKVEMTCNQAILGITTHSINTEYLFYYLFSLENELKNAGQTGTQSNLNKEMVKNLNIPYPKIEEQKAIAQILSDMDTEIEELEQQKSKTQKLKQGMMQQLLTGKIRLVNPVKTTKKPLAMVAEPKLTYTKED